MAEINEITEKIIGAAIEVHRHLGPDLLESAYEECLCYELTQLGCGFQRLNFNVPVLKDGIKRVANHYSSDSRRLSVSASTQEAR